MRTDKRHCNVLLGPRKQCNIDNVRSFIVIISNVALTQPHTSTCWCATKKLLTHLARVKSA